MDRFILKQCPRLCSLVSLSLVATVLLASVPDALRAQGIDMTGDTLTISNWASIGGGNTSLGTSLGVGDFNYTTNRSLAVGMGTTATDASIALGDTTTASSTSFATGFMAAAYSTSAAMGICTLASGYGSFSAGYSTTAQSYASFVVGRYNRTSVYYNDYDWEPTDPLFVVGNGTGVDNDPNAQRDALVVYKNGNVRISKAQGDISMGAFAQ